MVGQSRLRCYPQIGGTLNNSERPISPARYYLATRHPRSEGRMAMGTTSRRLGTAMALGAAFLISCFGTGASAKPQPALEQQVKTLQMRVAALEHQLAGVKK